MRMSNLLPGLRALEDNAGTMTDKDGRYSLKIADGVKRLEFSMLGYTKIVKSLGDKTVVNVKMTEQDKRLSEVVVIGYGAVSKKDLTGAVGQVNVEDLAKAPVGSFAEALAGRVSGVQVSSVDGQPGAENSIIIRGANSLTQNNSPLFVVDGIPMEDFDPASLSAEDIKSMSVLKDASAIAIYGSRAANGVIVVTTKRGRMGKPVINFNTRLTYTPNLNTSRLNLLNSEQKINLELELMKDTYEVWGDTYPSFYAKGAVASILKKYDLTDAYRKDGWDGLTPEAQAAINQLKTINTDWNDILFKDAFTQEYNFSISGGGEKVTYYNSLGYSKENGNVPGVSMSRFNLTSKTSYQVNRMLKLGVSLFANRRKNTDFVADKSIIHEQLIPTSTLTMLKAIMFLIMTSPIKRYPIPKEDSTYLKRETTLIKNP